jgi:hypothetical protein
VHKLGMSGKKGQACFFDSWQLLFARLFRSLWVKPAEPLTSMNYLPKNSRLQRCPEGIVRAARDQRSITPLTCTNLKMPQTAHVSWATGIVVGYFCVLKDSRKLISVSTGCTERR